MISLSGNAAQAGYYGAAQNVSFAASVVSISLSPILLSLMTQQFRARRFEDARQSARVYLRLVMYLLPIFAMGAATGPELMQLLFGPAYEAAGQAFAWLALASFGSLLVALQTSILIAAGHVLGSSVLAVGMLLGGIALEAFLIAIYGWAGAAAGAFVTQWVSVMIAGGMVYRSMGKLGILATAAVQISIAVVAAIVVWAIPSESLATIGKLALALVAYIAVLFMIPVFRSVDWPILRSFYRPDRS
ncbi:MAG: hypothetical protein WKF37_15185 [Bryobacteraceae bacterium]